MRRLIQLTGKKGAAQGDNLKERILTFLNSEQNTKIEWFSRGEISTGVHASSSVVYPMIAEMMSEGWLWARHNPGRADVIYVRLRREGDEV